MKRRHSERGESGCGTLVFMVMILGFMFFLLLLPESASAHTVRVTNTPIEFVQSRYLTLEGYTDIGGGKMMKNGDPESTATITELTAQTMGITFEGKTRTETLRIVLVQHGTATEVRETREVKTKFGYGIEGGETAYRAGAESTLNQGILRVENDYLRSKIK